MSKGLEVVYGSPEAGRPEVIQYNPRGPAAIAAGLFHAVARAGSGARDYFLFLGVFLKAFPKPEKAGATLIWQSGVPEERLKAAFWHQFNGRLEEYLEKVHWAPRAK